jgi:hypothetical protein
LRIPVGFELPAGLFEIAQGPDAQSPELFEYLSPSKPHSEDPHAFPYVPKIIANMVP